MSRESKNTAYLVKGDVIPDDTNVKVEDGAMYVKGDKFVYHAANTKHELSPTAGTSGGGLVQEYKDTTYNSGSPLDVIGATTVSPINLFTAATSLNFKTGGNDVFDSTAIAFKPVEGKAYKFRISFTFSPDISQNMIQFHLRSGGVIRQAQTYMSNRTITHNGYVEFDPFRCFSLEATNGVEINCFNVDTAGSNVNLYGFKLYIEDLGTIV